MISIRILPENSFQFIVLLTENDTNKGKSIIPPDTRRTINGTAQVKSSTLFPLFILQFSQQKMRTQQTHSENDTGSCSLKPDINQPTESSDITLLTYTIPSTVIYIDSSCRASTSLALE